MKHIKLTALLALVLCTVMLLASCGGATGKDPRDVKALKYDQLIKSYTVPETEKGSIDKLDLKGTVQDRSGSIYLLFNSEDKVLTVYNAKLNKVVYTCSDTEKITNDDIDFDLSNYYFPVEDDADDKTTLYSGDGTEIASVPYSGADIISNNDLILFGEKIYRRGEKDDAVYTMTAVEGADPRLPILLGSILESTDDYYYTVSKRGASGKTNPISVLFVYDRSLKLVNSYTPDPGATTVQAFVLDNGNVVFQYRYRLPANEENYTACNVNGTEKYLIKTEIFDLKKGTAKEVEFPYVINMLQGIGTLAAEVSDQITFAKGISNLAFVYPIVNRRIGSTNDSMILSLGNDLSVKGRLDAMVDLQEPGSLMEPINGGALRYTLADDTYMLADQKGKEIGRIASTASFRASFINLDEVFYDYALNVIFDCRTDNYEIIDLFENFAILAKETDEGNWDFYRWIPGSAPEKIIAGDSKLHYESFGAGYLISDETDENNLKVTYYDGNGNALLTTEKEAVIVISSGNTEDGAIGYTIDEKLNVTYYRVYIPDGIYNF